jgi:hypothetical protein
MDIHGPDDFALPMPTLPAGVAACEGFPRSAWYRMSAIITNDSGEDVARGVIRSVDPALVVDANNKPLGDNRVAIHIAESLCEAEVPSSWMWSIHSWDIRHVFVNGVSLHDHNETSIFNLAVRTFNQRPRIGVRSYNSSRKRFEPEHPPKKDTLLTQQSIASVASVLCCPKKSLQPFPRGQIQAIRSEILLQGGMYYRKNRY